MQTSNKPREALEEDGRVNLIQSVTNCNQVKDAPTTEKSSQVQTMDKWPRPLTNVCKCGNNQEAKPCATVKDANGVVVLHFIGRPWRSHKDAVAMATDFCERVNNAESSKCGNMALMREALELVAHMNDDGYWNGSASICNLVAKANAALSAPARNCDVGTAEEQDIRFEKFCNSHYNINNVDGECNACPLGEIKAECEFAWAQMPYEGGDK